MRGGWPATAIRPAGSGHRLAHRLGVALVVELGLVQLGVAAAGGQQLGVGAPLDHPAGLDHEDRVGLPDGRQTVGDDDGGPPGQGVGERGLDLGLRRRVEVGGRLIPLDGLRSPATQRACLLDDDPDGN